MIRLADDRQRLELFRKGDREALGEVYAAYSVRLAAKLRGHLGIDTGRGVRGFCGHMTPFDLNDLIQETFLRAFTDAARASYDGLRSYTAYLLGIARNVLADWCRTDARRARLFQDVVIADDEVTLAADSPETELKHRDVRDAFQAFLASLSEPDRILVCMRLGEQASRREVTEKTGYSAMRVRTREKALRRQLFEVLRLPSGRVP